MAVRGRTVQAVDGRSWTVRRRWVPRLGPETLWARFRRRVRQTVRRTSDLDGGSGCLDVGGLDDLVVVLVLLLVLALAVFIVIPLLVALLDVLLVALLAVLGVIARIAFRRPWTIEAVASDETRLAWHVVGWRQSGALVHDIADRLRVGVPLPEPGAWSQPSPGAT